MHTAYRYLQLGSKEWLVLCPKDALYLFIETYSLGISMKSEVVSCSQEKLNQIRIIFDILEKLQIYAKKILLLVLCSNLQKSGIRDF